MKVLAEISYRLENEPDVFKTLSTLTNRVVYIWENKRGYLICDQPWQTFSRRSVMDSSPEIGFMEIWSTTNDISDPPNDTDDMWDETYKTLEKKNYCMEWHPKSNQLRITWSQSEETLIDHKIITQVISEIENLGIGFPNFPTLISNSNT